MDYLYGGRSDIGYERELNEDYLSVHELDDATILAVIADGAGSKPTGTQAASICAAEIHRFISSIFETDKELVLNNAETFLDESLLIANRVLGAFKQGNEELYAGFAASVTCLLCWDNGEFAFAHAGNTRLYHIRMGKDGLASIRAMTRDHTEGRTLFDKGVINEAQYHTHPARLVLTSGLGVLSEPSVQTFSGNIKKNDFLLLTTDGIHYAIRPEPMADIILQSATCEDAADALVAGANALKYNDNMSALVIFRPAQKGQ